MAGITTTVVPGTPGTVGALIKRARIEAGWSQADLAARLGTRQPVVSRWERGLDEPRISTLARVMRALGRSLVLVAEPDDVDRAQLRQQLALTPEERLASVVNLSRTRANAVRTS